MSDINISYVEGCSTARNHTQKLKQIKMKAAPYRPTPVS